MSNIREFFHATIAEDTPEEAIPTDVTQVEILDRPVTSFFDEISDLASGAFETVITVTVPPGEIYFFQKAYFTGTNMATYTLVIDGAIKDKHRTYFGGPINGHFDFTGFNGSGLKLMEDSVIKINVFNHRPEPGDFSARIQVVSVPNVP